MKRNSRYIVSSLLLIPILFGVVFADLAGVFSFSDIPFVIAFGAYIVFLYRERTSSKFTFIVALFFLIMTGLSFIPTGEGRITERFAQWFYLFFLFGLIHYIQEVWHEK